MSTRRHGESLAAFVVRQRAEKAAADEAAVVASIEMQSIERMARVIGTGPQGIAGEQGQQGEPGAAGPAGPVGPVGPEGEPGPVGPIGPRGSDGVNGRDGRDGKDGKDGKDGMRGFPGPTGTHVVSTDFLLDDGQRLSGVVELLSDGSSRTRRVVRNAAGRPVALEGVA